MIAKLICRWFGHKPHEKTYSGAEYMRARLGPVDGMDREHWTLYARCARCDRSYRAGQVHGPLIRNAERVPATEGRRPEAQSHA